MGADREVAEEGGSGTDNFRKVLLRGGPGGATIWVGNLGVDSSYAEKREGVHMDSLQQVTGMKARSLRDKTWRKEGADRVLQAEGTKPLREYIKRRQATVAEWVDLQTIFEVCAKEKGYEGGKGFREQW